MKKDGIINHQLYEQQKVKILFICKEPNDPDNTPGDFRKWWREGIWGGFSARIAEWAYGILHNFLPYDEVWKDKEGTHQALQSIAFMNLKKTGGGGQANNEELWKVIKKNKVKLLNQIKKINPDIIVGSVTYKEAWKALFGEIDWKPSGYYRDIFKWKGIKVIHFYHPSNRFPSSMNYVLLEKIIRSIAFKNL